MYICRKGPEGFKGTDKPWLTLIRRVARMGTGVKVGFCFISMFNNIFLCDIKLTFPNSEWEMKKCRQQIQIRL